MTGVVVAALLAGCFNVTYTNPRLAPNGVVVAGTNSFFIGGLLGDARVPVYQMCPQGVAQIESGSDVVDVVLHLITFYIYTPRSYIVHCGGAVPQGYGPPPPPPAYGPMPGGAP